MHVSFLSCFSLVHHIFMWNDLARYIIYMSFPRSKTQTFRIDIYVYVTWLGKIYIIYMSFPRSGIISDLVWELTSVPANISQNITFWGGQTKLNLPRTARKLRKNYHLNLLNFCWNLPKTTSFYKTAWSLVTQIFIGPRCPWGPIYGSWSL